MKVNFTQGILTAARNVEFQTFLTVQPGGYVDHNAEQIATILVAAHKNDNYLIKLHKDVSRAWGPFANPASPRWLYWDVNMVTGTISRGATNAQPLYQTTQPSNPILDQHWFNTNSKIFYVWNGTEWFEKIRVFAGKFLNDAISYYDFGSQAGIVGEFDAGYILFDRDNKPIRVSDGGFLTSESVSVVDFSTGTSSIKLDQNVMVFEAAEPLPAYSLVTVVDENKIGLATNLSFNKPAIGIVDEHLPTGSIGNVIFRGLVTASDWSQVIHTGRSDFERSEIGKQLYLSETGTITFSSNSSIIQKIGTVVGKNSIYLNIDGMTSPSTSYNPTPIKTLQTKNNVISNTIVFRGDAEVGTSPSEEKWRIQKISITYGAEVSIAISWPNGNSGFVHSWVDHLTYNYI